MARKAIRELIEELNSWLPNYGDEEDGYKQLLFRLLATCPGGDRAVDAGFEPFSGMKWHEIEQLGRVLDTIQDSTDVEELLDGLLDEEEDEEEEDEED